MVSLDLLYAEIGAGLWGVGMVFLRNTGDYLNRSGNEAILAFTYLAVIPVTAASYEISAAITNTDPTSVKCLRAWTVGLTTAAVIDGIAICCFPEHTYALEPSAMSLAGASLLWGIGVAGAYGLLRTKDAKIE